MNLEYQLQKLISDKRYGEAAHTKKKIQAKMDDCRKQNEHKLKISIQNQMINLIKKQETEKRGMELKYVNLRNELFN